MLNTLWSFLLLLGIGYGLITGQAEAITEAILQGAASGIQLCLTMFGVIALWSGVMEIGERAGLVERLSEQMRPLLHFLFPHIPAGHPALRYIAANFVANILGLGWAATPAGLKAMEELNRLKEERPVPAVPAGTASTDMCTFLILNVSSLQLIPVNMIAYRSQYGSTDPTAIVGPGIAATAVSTAAAIIFCRIMERKRRT